MTRSFSRYSASRTGGVASSRSPLRRLIAGLLTFLILLAPALEICPVASAADPVDIQIGDYLQLGHIYFSNGYSGENDKDLTWQVIGEDGGKLLLFLADNLFAGEYDGSDHAVQNSGLTVCSYGSTSWRTSDIRTWFNSSAEEVRYDTSSHFNYSRYGVGLAQTSDFGTSDEPSYGFLPGFLSGFTVPELCLIETTSHEYISAVTEDVSPCSNWEASDYGTAFENAAAIYSETAPATVTDEVFLLSALEYRTYVVEQGLQQDVYVTNKGDFVSAKFWLSDSIMYNGMNTWLFYGMCNLYVDSRHQPARGYNGNHGVLVDSDNVWLRPACWIDASYIKELDGAGTITDPYVLTIDPSVLSRAASKNIYQEHPDKWVVTVLANKRDPGDPKSKDAYRLAPNATITTEAGTFTTNDLGWVEVPFSYGGATISLPGYYERTLDCMQMSESPKIYLEPESDDPTLLACWVGNHDVLHDMYTLDLLVTPDSVVKAEIQPGNNGGGTAKISQGSVKIALDGRGRKVSWGNGSGKLDPSSSIYLTLYNEKGGELSTRTLQLTVYGVTPEELPNSVSFSFFGKESGIEISSLGDKAKALKDVELNFDLKIPIKAECEVKDGKFYFVAGLAPSFKKDASSGKTSGENTDKEGKWKLDSGIDMLSDIMDNKNKALTNYNTLKNKKAFASESTNSAAFTGNFQALYYAEGYVNSEGKAVVTNQGGIVGGGAGAKGTVPLGIAIGPIPLFLKWSFGGDAAYKFRCATSDLVDAATRAITPDANLNVKFNASGSVNGGVDNVISAGVGIKGELVFSLDFKQYQLTAATIDGDINPFITGQVLWFSGEAEFGSLKEFLNVHDKLYEWPEKRTVQTGDVTGSASVAALDAGSYRPIELKKGGTVELGSDYGIARLSDGYVSSDPQLLELDGGKRIVYYVAPADSVDGLALTARYFDGTSWSGPITVDDNGTADLYPAAYLANGTAWVVWTDLNGTAEGLTLDEIGPLTRIRAASFDPNTRTFTTSTVSKSDGTAQIVPVLGTLNGELQIAWRANAAGDWFGVSGAEIRVAGMADGDYSFPATYTVNTPINSMVVVGDRVFWTADVDGDLYTPDDTELFCNGTRLTYNDVPDTGLDKAASWVYWLQDGELLSLYYNETENEPYDDETQITGQSYKILSNGNGTRLVLWIDQPVDENGAPDGGTRLYARYFDYSNRTWADEIFCLTDGASSVTDYSATLDGNRNLQVVVLARNIENDGNAIYTITVPYTADLSLDSVEYSGACYIDGSALDLDLKMTNHGARPVNAYQITVTDDWGNTVLQDVRNQTVDPGQTVTVTLPFDVAEAAVNVGLHAAVTVAGTTDTNPDNNACDFTLNWEDLSLENLHWALREDGDTAVIGTVVNRGYGSYGNVTVTLRSGTPDGEILQTQTLPGPGTLAAEGVSFVVPYEEDAVYYVRIEQEETDNRGGNDYDFVVLQSESRFTWGETASSDCGGDMTVCPSAIFADAPAYGNWAHNPIDWAVEGGVTNGTDPTHFSPNTTCTRAQIVAFLWRAAGSPEPTTSVNPFKDVKSGAYYYKAVLWAAENGITSGTSADKFSPNMGCSRAQVVTFLWRAEGSPEPKDPSNPFKDVTGGYYYKAVLWAVENEITNGTSQTAFSPEMTCTRAQIVTFLYRALAQ